MLQGGDYYWYISDGLGTVRAVVDSSGTSVGGYSSDEYGRQTALTGTIDRPHTYTGSLGVRNEVGSDSQLLYARQRWYDPGLGRWLSADPIGFAGGLNLYAYCGGDPVNRVDPSGLVEGEELFFAGRKMIIDATAKIAPRLAPYLAEEEAGAAFGPYGIAGVSIWILLRNLPGRPGQTPAPPQFTPLGGLPGGITPPGPCPIPLTRGQQSLLDALRNGRDVTTDLTTARRLLENSGLAPFTEQRHGDRPAPAGTFRGDLLNIRNPNANYIHPPGSAPVTHQLIPHYNLHFWSGEKATILLK